MITETRKQIIELIEHYMDKTLSEGCLIKSESGMIFKISEIVNEEKQTYRLIDRNGTCSLKGLIKEGGKKIGHYDITAVLNYIYNKNKLVTFFSNGTIYRYRYEDTDELMDIGEIPNKPLHIYTEEEDKQLLELLLNLTK